MAVNVCNLFYGFYDCGGYCWKEVGEWENKQGMNATLREQKKLLDIAITLDSVVGNDIYYSIINDISYENLCNTKEVLVSKRNFYRLREKTLEKFKEYQRKSTEQRVENKLAQSDKSKLIQ